MNQKKSQYEDKVKSLKKFLKIVSDPAKWKPNQVEQILKISMEYSNYFQNPQIYQRYLPTVAEFIHPPHLAKEMQDYLLIIALNKRPRRETLISVFRSYVKLVPDGRLKAKSIVSSFIRDNSISNILNSYTNETFLPYVISSQILDGDDVSTEVTESELAKGSILALAKNPSLLPTVQSLISNHFSELPIDHIVIAANASQDIMKFVLSKIVPMIIEGDRFGFEIIQRLSATPNGKPACIVAKALREKQNIKCLL